MAERRDEERAAVGQFGLRVPQVILERVASVSEATGLSRTAVVRLAIQKGLPKVVEELTGDVTGRPERGEG